MLTRSELIGHLGSLTVAAITSTRRGARSEVDLDASHGLPKPCAVNLHNVATIGRSEVGAHIATLSDDAMAMVDAALQFALGVGERSGG